jgi:hypothetical protein
MAVTVVWDDVEKTILRMDFAGRWTWEEFQDAFAEFHATLDMVDYKVDTVINLSESIAIPENAVSNFVKGVQQQHQNDSGLNVIVSKTIVIQVLWNVFNRVYAGFVKGVDIKLVSTLEEARKVIATSRALKEIS